MTPLPRAHQVVRAYALACAMVVTPAMVVIHLAAGATWRAAFMVGCWLLTVYPPVCGWLRLRRWYATHPPLPACARCGQQIDGDWRVNVLTIRTDHAVTHRHCPTPTKEHTTA